jgi:hypothetical protein
LEAEIFNGIVDGSCALAKALAAQGAGSVDWKSVPELKATVEGVDRKLQLVLAYSAGHEAFEMEEHIEALPQDPSLTDEIWIKLAELDPYFASVEDTMIARGGESRARAERIRQKIDAAWAALPRADWMAGFDAAGILADLEAEFGIDVRG